MREPPCLVPSFQSLVGPRTCCIGAVPAYRRPSPLLARPISAPRDNASCSRLEDAGGIIPVHPPTAPV